MIVLVSLYLYCQAKVIVRVRYMHVQPVKSDCARLFACRAYGQARMIVLDSFCLYSQAVRVIVLVRHMNVQPSKSD